MQTTIIALSVALLLLIAFSAWQHARRLALAREHHIRAYVFPSAVLQELTKVYPSFQPKDISLAARALREFFLVHARAGGQLIFMPSKVIDTLWHAFILDTRAYHAFCKAAFGSYFHHIPERRMGAADKADAARWTTWRLACLEENIHPTKATRLPLLFALDAKLGIPGAVTYELTSFKPPATSSNGCGGGGGSDGCGGGCGGD